MKKKSNGTKIFTVAYSLLNVNTEYLLEREHHALLNAKRGLNHERSCLVVQGGVVDLMEVAITGGIPSVELPSGGVAPPTFSKGGDEFMDTNEKRCPIGFGFCAKSGCEWWCNGACAIVRLAEAKQ